MEVFRVGDIICAAKVALGKVQMDCGRIVKTGKKYKLNNGAEVSKTVASITPENSLRLLLAELEGEANQVSESLGRIQHRVGLVKQAVARFSNK